MEGALKICTTCGGSFDEDVMMCPNDGTPLFASAVAVEDEPPEVAPAPEASDVTPATPEPAQAEAPATVFDATTAEVEPFAAGGGEEPPGEATATEADGAQAADEEDAPEAADEDASPETTPVAADAEATAEGSDEAPPHTDTELIVANLLAAEEPATPAPEEDPDEVIAEVEVEPVAEAEVEEAIAEVEPLPELEPTPGPEITDAPTPVPDGDESGSVLDLIEDTIADDSAIQRIQAAEDPVDLDDAKAKKVVIPAKVEPKKSGGSGPIIIVAAIVVLAILAAVGYFVVLPMLGG